MWKPLFGDRNDHSNHMETSLYMETAQRSKSQRPRNFFGSDHMETSLYMISASATKSDIGPHTATRIEKHSAPVRY